LGFFIAKTLLERSGAKLSLANQVPPLHGATIKVAWSRTDFERPLTAPPLEPAAPTS
jgi:two-component system sensor histidine kinase RegB